MWLDTIVQDLRETLRSFRRDAGGPAIAVGALALAIGAATAMASVIEAVLLRPLPFDPDRRLVRLIDAPATAVAGPLARGINALEIAEIRHRSRTLTDLGVYQPGITMTVETPGGAVRARGARMSPHLLRGVEPSMQHGRIFDTSAELPGGGAVIVLSHAMWQQQFGGDPLIVGQQVMVDGRAHTIVGVATPNMAFPDAQTQFWVPFELPSGPVAMMMRLLPLARLSDGVDAAAATGEVQAILTNFRRSSTDGPRLALLPPGSTDVSGVHAVLLHEHLVDPIRPALVLLSAATVFVLLVACANVTNLLLARATTRQRDVAIRRALGARPGRVIQQAIAEGGLLSLAAAALGTGLAAGLVMLVRAIAIPLPRTDLAQMPGLPRVEELSLNWTMAAYALAVAVVTTLLVSVAPAIRNLRATPMPLIHRSAAGGQFGAGRGGVSPMLVIAQLALATLLAVGAGLLIQSFLGLSSVHPGYEPRNVLTFQVFLPAGASAGRATSFAEQLMGRLGAVPGIDGAGYSERIPTTTFRASVLLRRTPEMPRPLPPPPPAGGPRPPDRPDVQYVSPGFFAAMGTRILEGRGFDEAREERAVLVNRALARSGVLGERPLGQQVFAAGAEPWTVIGIVEDVRQQTLERGADPQIFFDIRLLRPQAPPPGVAIARADYFAVRSARPRSALIPAIRSLVAEIEPAALVDNVAGMEQILGQSISRPRLVATLAAQFAALAVVISLMGVYALMTYSVMRRRHEIAIRMALGADLGGIIRLVLRRAALVTVSGIATGLLIAASISRYLSAQMHGVSARDWSTYAVVSATLAAVAFTAAILPAFRAGTIAPAATLRAE